MFSPRALPQLDAVIAIVMGVLRARAIPFFHRSTFRIAVHRPLFRLGDGVVALALPTRLLAAGLALASLRMLVLRSFM